MDENAKRYARRVLLIHLLLLVAVLALVASAAREIYSSTREQVIEQATSRQSLLASQTARGIESYYQSILNNLDLLRRAENDDAPGEKASVPEAPVPTRTVASVARGSLLGPILWKQLEGRISLLFGIDRDMLSRQDPTIRIIGTDTPSLSAAQIVVQSRDWLEAVEKPAISEFQLFGGEGYNLICIPFPHIAVPETRPPGGGGAPPAGQARPDDPNRAGRGRFVQTRDTFRMIIAAVPIREIQARFLKTLNDDPDTGAWLIDERLTAMAASRPQLVGANMGDISDPSIRDLATDYIQHGRAGTEFVPKAFHIGTANFVPSIVCAEPISIGGKTWELFIATSMAQADGVVQKLFHRAFLWGIFVVVSITGILVSTAVQMIRSRLRSERLRHDMLTRELTQAREIQLAWLPESSPASKLIDIAAVNSPASHISGDFYNWFDLPDGRLVVTIGDVTGHGMAAAFLMATTQLLVRNTMARLGDPGQCLAEVNRQLCVQVFNGQFVTMLIMVVDLTAHSLEIATAGHPAPLIADGESFQPLDIEPQLVLGVERHTTYKTESYHLPPCASLLLYTDGVVECVAAGGCRFSTEKLQLSLYGKYETAQAILHRVINAVDTFRGGHDLADDLTLVALQLQPSGVPLLPVTAHA